MSISAKNWCKKRGELHSFTRPKNLDLENASIDPEKRKEWAKFYPGNFEQARKAWFYKPFVLKQSPYTFTLWLDLDCEVKKSLTPLYTPLLEGFDLAIVKFKQGEFIAHNSGVIGVRKLCKPLDLWIENTFLHHQDYLGDENILLKIMRENNLNIAYYPPTYNWPSLIEPIDKNATIIHHIGETGKNKLLQSWAKV